MGALKDISTTQLDGKDYMELSYQAAEALHSISEQVEVTADTLASDEMLFRLSSSYLLQFNDGVYNFRNFWLPRLPMDDYYPQLISVRNILAHTMKYIDYELMAKVIQHIAHDYKVFKGLFLIVGGDEDSLTRYNLQESDLLKVMAGGNVK